jgi:hypothetical protein
LRDGRTSRRATPDEVKDRVWAHPSSDHRRKLEELKQEQLKRAADLSHEKALKHQAHLDQISEDGRRQRDAMFRSIYPNI